MREHDRRRHRWRRLTAADPERAAVALVSADAEVAARLAQSPRAPTCRQSRSTVSSGCGSCRRARRPPVVRGVPAGVSRSGGTGGIPARPAGCDVRPGGPRPTAHAARPSCRSIGSPRWCAARPPSAGWATACWTRPGHNDLVAVARRGGGRCSTSAASSRDPATTGPSLPADHLWRPGLPCPSLGRIPFDPGFARTVRGGRWTPPGTWPTLYLCRDVGHSTPPDRTPARRHQRVDPTT